MFIGLGTVVNVVAVVVGSLVGLLLGHRIPLRTRETITDVLGLMTLVIGGLSVMSLTSPALVAEVGPGAPMLIVLGALLVGAVVGSGLRLEQRIDSGADWIRRRFTREGDESTFVDGLVTATLVFCVGPLTILGSLSDGLGRGAEQLLLKSAVDLFAAMAFASTLGVGVLVSALAVGVIQGTLTLLGFLLGDFLTAGQVDALTAAGGVLLLGIGLRLLHIKQVAVGDALPALLVAPVLVWAVGSLM